MFRFGFHPVSMSSLNASIYLGSSLARNVYLTKTPELTLTEWLQISYLGYHDRKLSHYHLYVHQKDHSAMHSKRHRGSIIGESSQSTEKAVVIPNKWAKYLKDRNYIHVGI